MKTSKFHLISLVVLLLFIAGCKLEQPPVVPTTVPATAQLKVYYIDVGQGDSMLIISPHHKNMLIDAATNAEGDKVISFLNEHGIKKIDVIIGTHPDEDHIGGMDRVINSLDIGEIYMPKKSKNTRTFKDVLKSIKNKGLQVTSPVAGENINLDPAVNIKILAPNSDKYDKINNYSIVIKLIYGNTSFLFTGDAEKESEQEMLNKRYDMKADVLKVGHHGSHTSTTPEFLEAVSPEYAIISVGKGNKFGHPHKETIKKLKEKNITIYRTDNDGTIMAVSDGKGLKFEVNVK